MDYDQFVGRVQNLARLSSQGEAVAAIRATLMTLGERLQGEGGRHVASQLPREIGMHVGTPGGERIGLREFYARVASRGHIKRLPDAAYQARVVMQVLREAISAGETRDILAQLSPEFDELFLSGSEGGLHGPRKRGQKNAAEKTAPPRRSPDAGAGEAGPSASEKEGFTGIRVAELMTDAVVTAAPEDTVAEAARRMQQFDCGALPVADEEGRPIGMITDRDIALYVAGRALYAENVLVRECMTHPVRTCDTNDTTEACLSMMAQNRVRRMPVVNQNGRLVGIVSQADLVRHAEEHKGQGERRAVASTISAISEPHLPPL